jgi:16S rRNA (guanine527-N7)-methyltransferase
VPSSTDEPPGAGPIDPRPPVGLRAAAERIFGDRLPLAVRYAELLMTDGVVRGLIGPREAPRIWDRHLLNCAVVGELIQRDARVADVGSGAGLPGIVLAVARPDLSVILVEPLARRTAFLLEAAAALGLDRTTVVRARAEECVPGRGAPRFELADVVTARAVAPLDRLTAWCLPLAAKGGRVLALKGESAVEEVEAHRDVIARLGGDSPLVRHCGVGVLEAPTTVIEITRSRLVEGRSPSGEDRKRRRAHRTRH